MAADTGVIGSRVPGFPGLRASTLLRSLDGAALPSNMDEAGAPSVFKHSQWTPVPYAPRHVDGREEQCSQLSLELESSGAGLAEESQ